MKKLAIIIPAYNEEQTICKVISSIPKKIAGVTEQIILVINDGSQDNTAGVAQRTQALVINHPLNQGVGAAIITGLEAAKMLKADLAIVIDADGQHDPGEIERLITPIVKKNCDVAIGSRLLDRNKNMPAFRLLGQLVMNFFTFALYQIWVLDSQSGFRALSKKAIKKMKLSSAGYEIASEIIGEIKRNKLKFLEIPIKTIYTDYSKGKAQFWLNGFNIIFRLIIRNLVG